jgi:hypothetical protein
MKRISLILPLVLLTLWFTACKKEQVTVLSDNESKETMSNDVSGKSGGTAVEIDAAARTSAVLNNSIFCGLTGDTTITQVSGSGNLNFTVTWTWDVNCISGVPSSISFDNTGSASYEGSSINFSNTFVGNAEVTGLGGSFEEYSCTGASVRTGTGTTEVKRRTKTYTYVNTIAYTSVKVRKSDHKIMSGTGTAHLVGVVVDGDDFDRTATFVFNGNGTYTLTLDTGEEFTFNLN